MLTGTAMSRSRMPAPPIGRRAVRRALERRGRRERLVIALLLVERLNAVEVASALGLSVRQVTRTYASLLEEIARSATPRRATARSRPVASVDAPRMRRSA
jgi:DNA-directed RNA polymerase specialized sigma24 family protein